MRGHKSEVGDVRVSPNGYHNTRTETGWRFTHHLIMEEILGRKLDPDERVTFKDGKRSNLNPDNLQISIKGRGSLYRRKAQLEVRIAELQAEIAEIDKELKKV